QLPLHEGEREPVAHRRLPHRARPRGRDAPPLRPDGRSPRGRRRLHGEARAALPGPVSAMHIRQIALVARELAPVVADLTAVLGVRIAWQVELDDIATVHLHPRDLGGAIVSLDQPVPPESWRWGGPEWQAKVRTDAVRGIVSVTIQADDPPRMAARWAEVLGLPAPRRSEAASTLALSP